MAKRSKKNASRQTDREGESSIARGDASESSLSNAGEKQPRGIVLHIAAAAAEPDRPRRPLRARFSAGEIPVGQKREEDDWRRGAEDDTACSCDDAGSGRECWEGEYVDEEEYSSEEEEERGWRWMRKGGRHSARDRKSMRRIPGSCAAEDGHSSDDESTADSDVDFGAGEDSDDEACDGDDEGDEESEDEEESEYDERDDEEESEYEEESGGESDDEEESEEEYDDVKESEEDGEESEEDEEEESEEECDDEVESEEECDDEEESESNSEEDGGKEESMRPSSKCRACSRNNLGDIATSEDDESVDENERVDHTRKICEKVEVMKITVTFRRRR